MYAPTKKNIILELIEKEKVTSSGIILKAADPNEANMARVVAIGKEVTQVLVDEIVLPNWNSVLCKTSDGERDLYVIPESELVAVYE
jgi:co-chaperonin GroES (HSP10)